MQAIVVLPGLGSKRVGDAEQFARGTVRCSGHRASAAHRLQAAHGVVEEIELAHTRRSLRALRYEGVVAQIGVLANTGSDVSLPTILHKRARIQGIYVGSRRDFVEMNRALELGAIRPVGEEFAWTEARAVFEKMQAGEHFGKLVLTVR